MKNLPVSKTHILVLAGALVVVVIGGAVLFKALQFFPKNNTSLTDDYLFDDAVKTATSSVSIQNDSAKESPTGIYLEQKEYKQGEKITGAVRNSEDFDILVSNISIEKLSLSDCDSSIGNIETKDCAQREWKKVKHNIGCACGEVVKCEGTNIKAQAHNIYGFNWNQNTDGVSTYSPTDEDKPMCKIADAGIYRVKANYREVPNLPPGAVSEAQIEQYIYSKEFAIAD